nr:MAG TPA: hydrolase [Caudoviricetes sp.]
MQKIIIVPIDTLLNYNVNIPSNIKMGDSLILKFLIFEKGLPKDISNQTASIVLKKSDGTSIEQTATNISSNMVTITLDKQATACKGKVFGEIALSDETGVTITNDFVYTVKNTFSNDILIKSQDSIQTLEDMRAIIRDFEDEISVIGTSAEAISALNSIKDYIDSNLPELINQNSLAEYNISELETENPRAETNIGNLKSENETAEDKLDKFRLYDTTNLIQQVQDNTTQLNENTKNLEDTKTDLEDTKTDLETNYAKNSDLNIAMSELSVHKAQIANLTKTGDVDTTGNKELSDIRIDIYGQTHDTAGDAVRNQIEPLSQEVFNVQNKELTLNFESNSQFIDGTIETNSGYYHVDISVSNKEKYYITGYNFYSMPLYLLLDSSDNIISKCPDSSSDSAKFENIIIDIPSDVTTLRINYTTKIGGTGDEYKPILKKEVKNSNISELQTNYSTIKSTVDNCNNELFNVGNSDIILNFESNSQFVDGTIKTDSGYYHVDINIDKNKKYKITGYNFYSMPLYLLLDASDDIVSYFPTDTSVQSKFEDINIDIPSNAKKIRINYTTKVGGTGDEYKPVLNSTLTLRDLIVNSDKKTDNTNPLEEIKTDGYASIFKKIGIIGDSLSSGAQDITAGSTAKDMQEYSWATFMEKAIGCETVRLCKGGLQLQNWHSTFESKAREDANKCTAYIIMLGHNDTSIDTGEKTDIDVSNPLNSSTTTQYGLYGKLIGTIKDIEPNAKIFCVTYPIYYVERYRTNNIARDCATLFDNCYCIDLYKYDKYTKLSANTDMGTPNPMFAKVHGTVLGYKDWSDEIITYIDYIVRNNMEEFINVGYIGTGVSY